jgi:hypothetical protein
MALYDREMFQEEYSINNEQMPYIKLYQTMKRCGVRTLEMSEGFLSDQDIEITDAIHDAFSWYGPKAIKAFMKIERAELMESRDVNNNKIISKESIKQCFKDICERYEIYKVDDIYKYPDKLYFEIRNVNN